MTTVSGTPERAEEAMMHVMDQNDRTAARVKGCLLGGAVGDALGAPVEFFSLANIRRRWREGIADYLEAYGRVGAITDDTQMTLFTAEGVVRAYVRQVERGICSPRAVIHHAYVRWLVTQGVKPRAEVAAMEPWPDGWLIGERRLWARRAPGKTCLTALAETVTLGEAARNDSKGCGTIMRVAPVGLVCQPRGDEGRSPAYELGADASVVTHGHPAAIVAGGSFALLIAFLVEGLELRRAVDALMAFLAHVAGSDVVTRALGGALKLADEGGDPTAEAVERLGGGWVAEEALAIALYCALRAESFEHGVCLAVNHSGDSDSTGSLTGQLLGTAWGHEVIPARWLADLELRDVIGRVADDLVAVRSERFDTATEWSRYPGW
ncbi:MAG: ADP-ribosylglycohydrolase family protein [Myxococcales bacterium]|nr:ADP-ribosylglycohydrolase family protein [Myxococcales bacterium]